MGALPNHPRATAGYFWTSGRKTRHNLLFETKIMTFHWQTEDDGSWDQPAAPPPPSTPSKWRAWPLALLVVAILTAGSLVIYQQLTTRVTGATDAVRAEVTAAFHLMRDAGTRADRELFLSLLSGRDPSWTEGQMRLLAANQVGGRAQWDMATATDPEIVDISLSPDLNAATVTSRQPLRARLPDGREQIITLTQIDVFRRGDIWLLSPPDEAFWGTEKQTTWHYLNLRYPARDESWVQRLATDWEAAVARFCQENFPQPPTPCENLRIDISLSSSPHTLISPPAAMIGLRANAQLQLPSPTLLGIPVDEESYQAVRRAYAARILSAAMNQIADYDCCTLPALHFALLNQALHQLDLRPALLTTDDYAQLLQEDMGLTDILRRLQATRNLPPQEMESDELPVTEAAALAAFLRDLYPEVTPWASFGQESREDSLAVWVSQQLGSGAQVLTTQSSTRQNSDWYHFLFAQAQPAQADPPLPLSEEAISLICPERLSQVVVRYDLTRDSVSRSLEGRAGYQILATSPDRRDIILQVSGEAAIGSNLMEVAQWDGQTLRRLYADAQGSYAFLAKYDPHRRYLALAIFGRQDSEMPYIVLLDMDECNENGCAATSIGGWPFWSPDGRRTLLMGMDGAISLGDAQGLNRRATPPGKIDALALAFAWLDNETYVYTMPASTPTPSTSDLYSYSLTTGESRLLISAGEYARLLPDIPANNDVGQIIYLESLPNTPRDLIFVTNISSMLGSYQPAAIFRLDTDTQTTTVVGSQGLAVYDFPPIRISPDGRWLTMLAGNRESQPATSLWLYDLTDAADEGKRIASGESVAYDWSGDGNWLAVYHDRRLTTVAPAYNYERLFMPGADQCVDMAWQQ